VRVRVRVRMKVRVRVRVRVRIRVRVRVRVRVGVRVRVRERVRARARVRARVREALQITISAAGTLVGDDDLGSGDLPPPPSAPPADLVAEIELPAGWQCESSRYGGGDGCDCGCGAYDPDCAAADAYGRPMLGAWGCAAGEPCLPPGVCAGRPAVALFPAGGLELRSAVGLSAPSRAVAPAPVDATVPAIASFVAADPDNGDSAVSVGDTFTISFDAGTDRAGGLLSSLALSRTLTPTLTSNPEPKPEPRTLSRAGSGRPALRRRHATIRPQPRIRLLGRVVRVRVRVRRG